MTHEAPRKQRYILPINMLAIHVPCTIKLLRGYVARATVLLLGEVPADPSQRLHKMGILLFQTKSAGFRCIILSYVGDSVRLNPKAAKEPIFHV